MSQAREVQARNCPNCGALLDASPPGMPVVCRFCGHRFQPPPETNPAPRIVVMTPGMRPLGTPPVRRGAGRSIFSVAFTMVVVGVVAFFSIRGAHVPSIPPSIVKLSSSVVAEALSTFLWDTTAGPPMPAAVGTGGSAGGSADGVEGFVGRIRTRGDDMLYVAGFEGDKLAQIWKVGPFGTYSQGYQATFASVVGRHVVVADYRADLHVYDVATGKETHTLKLTDRARGMCASPDGKDRVWIEVVDEKNVLVDADAGTTALSPRPAWCPNLWAAINDCRGWLKRGPPRLECKGPEGAPRVPGFEAENVIEQGDLGVALGKKHLGTGTPVAVGYDPKTKALRWQQALASGDQADVTEASPISIMDALAGGRFVAPYQLTAKGWHFTAFDARSGQRIWDIPLQPLIGVDQPEGFSMSATRVYVMRTSSVEVYEAATGALVGTVGVL